jgi:hypothetical protein
MLISSMLPWSLFGVDLAPYQRLMWFAYGHLEREQRLNQRAFVAWCQRPHSYASWVQAMQTTSLLLPTALCREVLRLTSDRAALLKGQTSNNVPSRTRSPARN